MLPWADWKEHTWYEQGSKPAEVRPKQVKATTSAKATSRSHVAKAAPIKKAKQK